VTVTDTAVQQYSTTTLARRPRKTTTTTTTTAGKTTTADSDSCRETTQVLVTSYDEDENANTPDELTSSASVIRLPQLHQKPLDCYTQIGTFLSLSRTRCSRASK